MKKIIVGIMSIIGVVAFSQLITKTDENLNSQATSVESSSLSAIEQIGAPASQAPSSVVPLMDKRKAKDVIDDEASANVGAEARSVAYQQATETFRSLGASEKRQRRKTALGKVIAGKGVGVEDEVALQQAWELVGEAEPGYQHKKDDTKIDVNGTTIDVAQPGIVVADSVMVYISPSKASLAAELGAIAGINNIEPVFKNAKPSNVPGVRDPSGWQRIELSAPASRIKSIVRALKAFDGVTEAEPVYERKLSITGPLVSDLNDPLMSDQWHLDAAKIKEAWAFLESNSLPAGGDESIVVAVIDSGVDYNHPDLADNMWVNTQEIPGNGVDDDNNGFVDDIHGVTVVGESYSHSGNPDDDHGHGTHVAGIIASTGGNGLGGVGVAYNSKIMAVKAGQYSGVLTTADIAEGIYYAVDNGADVINMSFGGYGRSQVEQDALAIAFSKAVLIAAAGNDALPNQPCPLIGAPLYPAAHPWVLGVMSRNENPNAKGDYLSGFSNRECVSNNGMEYELMAPGAAIWSTLPDGSYSAWSGTSMAAPVVAGMAALARTRWPDKTAYSSRFIMGQVGATGPSTKAFTPLVGLPKFYKQADAYASLASTPQPELSYEEHWLFDAVATQAGNDADGRVDAGEKVELAITIRNRWGRADNVVATLSTPSGASAADPYVTFQTDSVNYGAVGSFNKDDNGIRYNDELEVTGVANPFVFSVDADTPNNHIIPFTLTMTAENGLDPADSSTYTFTSKFSLVVQRGRELPSILDGDAAGTDGGNVDTDGQADGIITLDASALWIIDKPVLLAKGTNLKVKEGAQVQFWSSSPDAAQTAWRPAYLRVEGTLDMEGSASNPIKLSPSSLFPTRLVQIFKGNDSAVINMSYTNAENIWAESENYENRRNWDTVNYNRFTRIYPSEYLRGGTESATSPGSIGNYISTPFLPSIRRALGSNKTMGTGTGNQLYRLALEYMYTSENYSRGSYVQTVYPGYSMTLFDNVGADLQGRGTTTDSVFLKNYQEFEGYNGTVAATSKMEDFGTAKDFAAVEPFTMDGKTYAIFYSKESAIDGRETPKTRIKDAQAFARSLGGTMMTVSSEAEMVGLSVWLYDLSLQVSSYWEEKYPKLCEPNSSDNANGFCKTELGSGEYTVGLLRQNDGSYAWDGDDSGYGDEFLASQRYWDRVGFQTAAGEAITADDIENQDKTFDAIVFSNNYRQTDTTSYEWKA